MIRFRQKLNRHIAYGLSALVAASSLGLYGLANAPFASAQSADSIYVTAASGTYGVGSSFTVSIRENSSTAVNAVQADLAYSGNLQFVSIDASGSAFGIDASSTGGGGSVSMARGTTSPVTGDQLVARVTFKALAAGSGTITMQNSSVVLSSTTNSDVVTTRNGGTYTLQTGATPAPATPPAATPPASVSRKPVANLPSTTISPQGSAQSTPLPGDASVELEAPATIVTTPDAGKKVDKVEYLINGKIVATDTEPPYTHSVDTTKYRNGTYTLTTKTYYADGKVDTSNASLVVKNKFGAYQLWLQLLHYAWIIVILLVIIAELLYLKFFRRRHHGPTARPYGPAGGGYGSGGAGTYGPTASSPVAPMNTITPSAPAAPTVTTPSMAGPVITPISPPAPAAQNSVPSQNTVAPQNNVPPAVTPPQQ